MDGDSLGDTVGDSVGNDGIFVGAGVGVHESFAIPPDTNVHVSCVGKYQSVGVEPVQSDVNHNDTCSPSACI
jgi:hypothetical protein